jgi:mercuric reductase
VYKHRSKKPKQTHFDLIVIGTGAGGGVASHLAAASGKSVAVIEDMKIGGECPNFGCVPTKALLQAAEAYRQPATSERFGVHLNASFDYKKVKEWKDRAVYRTGTAEGEDLYEHEGITVIPGHGHFIDQWTLAVNEQRYYAKTFLIATGTKSVVPPIPGLQEAGFITYREAIDLTAPPKSLFIIGGGAIGCEFAQLFNSFGAKIHIADIAPYLVAMEDQAVGVLLGEIFTKRGISLHMASKVARVEKIKNGKRVHIDSGNGVHQVTVEEVLVASGKVPNTDLGLENAGVAYTKRGITVDKYMRTSNKHIYAAGDIVGPYHFTHTASYQSRVAVHNMFHRKRKVAASYHAVPRCVFVEPEIACVGLTEKELQNKHVAYRVGEIPVNIIGRANTSDVDEGFVKVMVGKGERLLGASIVSPRAGEMVHELTLAIQKGLSARAITETIHAFPTWSEAVRRACQKAIDTKK